MLSLVLKIFLVLIVIVSELSERDFLVLGSFFFCFSCQTFLVLLTLLWLPPGDVQWALTGRGPSPFLIESQRRRRVELDRAERQLRQEL
jgi:hypothetical protein